MTELIITYYDDEKTIVNEKYYTKDGDKNDDRDGEKNGIYRSWYENGQIYVECMYVDDMINGLYKSWYEDGQIEEECNYSDGEKEGIYKNGIMMGE